MNYVYNIFNNFKYYYNSMNPATLSGAIDVIVVEQPDGSFQSTPFHVRFGKWAVFNIDDKFVDIQINNERIEGIKMKLGDNGVAFFVEEIEDGEDLPEYLATSPVPGASESDEEKVDNAKRKLTKKPEGRKKMPKTNAASKKSHRRNESIVDSNVSKQGLPFSSSIFSYRKYRSLPDLTCFANNQNEQKEEDKSHLNHLDLPSTNHGDKPLHHSKSTIISKDIESFKPSDHILKSKRKPKYSESESDDECKQKKHEKAPQRTISDIADGALSDSEVDRQRFDNHNDASVDWRWGEYPEFKKTNEKSSDPTNKDKSKTPESASAWNWFGWRSSNRGFDNGEKGVYLGDLMHKDPNQREKYFGTSSASQMSNVDSGNGFSVGPSPSSPSAMSMESLIEENVSDEVNNPNASDKLKEQAPTPQEVDVALEKADIVEKQMLAGTDQDGEVASSTFKEEVDKNLQKHVDSANNSRSDLPTKSRSMSGTSVTSDTSLFEEGGVYTSTEDGRRIRYKRTLRLKSDQLKDLQLEYGSNNARFSISTKIQGTAWASCHIYLLRWCERIVISDIDGTITKSDVLGHIIPAIGGTWAHTSIVDLYRRIQNNGYRIIYLSSRAIGQSYQTKKYLSSVIQASKTLPDGPVLLSPTSVLMAFRKEVIERKPEEFKIACLTDLMSLFPVKRPFYAGFGNRETDIKSYVAVGIPPERILIIDPTGRVENAARIGFETNYDNMLRDNVVDLFFPPLHVLKRPRIEDEDDPEDSTKSLRQLNYSSFIHWRTQPDVENFDQELENYESKRV